MSSQILQPTSFGLQVIYAGSILHDGSMRFNNLVPALLSFVLSDQLGNPR